MTNTSNTSPVAGKRPSHQIRDALSWTLVTLAGACLVAYLSLENVSGVQKNADGSCCDVEFMNGSWWNLAFALGYPVYRVARASYWFAPAAVLIATFVQLFVANTVVERYTESGWGDGLESLSYVWALVMGAFFTLAAIIGVLLSLRRRSQAVQPSDHAGTGAGSDVRAR